jgi:hypothetical protein
MIKDTNSDGAFTIVKLMVKSYELLSNFGIISTPIVLALGS